jgi:hypothetical protein
MLEVTGKSKFERPSRDSGAHFDRPSYGLDITLVSPSSAGSNKSVSSVIKSGLQGLMTCSYSSSKSA